MVLLTLGVGVHWALYYLTDVCCEWHQLSSVVRWISTGHAHRMEKKPSNAWNRFDGECWQFGISGRQAFFAWWRSGLLPLWQWTTKFSVCYSNLNLLYIYKRSYESTGLAVSGLRSLLCGLGLLWGCAEYRDIAVTVFGSCCHEFCIFHQLRFWCTCAFTPPFSRPYWWLSRLCYSVASVCLSVVCLWRYVLWLNGAS